MYFHRFQFHKSDVNVQMHSRSFSRYQSLIYIVGPYLIENANKLYNFIIYIINMVLPTKVKVDENA